MASPAPKSPPRKGVILPAEHGSWGMIAEPLLLGLLILPGGFALSVSVFAFCMFLLRVPLLRLLKARRMPGPDPHADRVRRFTLRVGIPAIVSLILSVWMRPDCLWMLPFVLATPAALFALRGQNSGRTRHLLPELLAAVAIGSPVAAILIGEGEALAQALSLWLLLGLKSVGSIFFVRTQIRRFHQRPSGKALMLCLQLLLILPVWLLVQTELLPAMGLWMMILLALRALLLSNLPVGSAKQVGWIEVGVSVIFVTAVGLGGHF